MADQEPLVLVDTPRPRVRRLTLNRPGKRNALSNALRSALFEELRIADADDAVGVIVLRGAGPCWSSGYDLAQDHAEPLPRHTALADGFWPRHLVDGWLEIWDYATPVIAQVHGYCLAGGTELATACDLVYVAEDASVGYPMTRALGSPDMAWHAWLLGLRQAMEAVLTGDPMSGIEAAERGFANRAFPVAELEDSVLEIATRIALVPADVLAINKRAVHRSMEAMGIRTAVRSMTELQALSAHQASVREYVEKLKAGVSAALDERDAPFGDYRASRGS